MPYTERKDNRDTGLIDVALLQKFQEQFCHANRIYLACIGSEEGVLTGHYGSDAERDFLHKYVNQASYMTLLMRLSNSTVEHMAEETFDVPFIKMCGVSTDLDEKSQVMWCATAIIEDYLTGEEELPEGIMTTTEAQFYRSIEFLEYFSNMLFAVKMDEIVAEEAMQESVAAKQSIAEQLGRSETMTQILAMLDSENGFGKIVDDILKLTCECLGISAGCLMREGANGQNVEMVCEYATRKEWYHIQEFQNVPREEIPFFTGKPYLISSDSIFPPLFDRFFEKLGATAAIFQPIEVNDKVQMYLCFYEIQASRVWETRDIDFINGVKRIVQSILSRRIAKNSLAGSYASLEAILENMGCGIYVLDPESKQLLYKNQKFEQLFSNTITAGKINDLLYPDGEVYKGNSFEEIYSPEEDKWMDIHKVLINWVDGRQVILCTIYDITDKKIYQKKIEMQANNDFLTGLYNRMKLEQDLDHYIRSASLENSEGALLYIDLDDFKHINEGLGHQYGDALLKAISHGLQRIEGVTGNCYRMGGDEFIIVIPDVKKHSLERVCQDIKDMFTNPWLLKGEDYYCTMSMGIVSFPSDGNTVEDLIRKADMALFSAKREGKNRIEYYNGHDEGMAHRRLDMEKNMRKATLEACKEFEVYYQPIVDISKPGDPCVGAEALVRWNSSELGFISPVDFIPLAEYLGLINPIGDYVLMEAAKRCRYWNEMGHPEYKVNVNLSVVQLLQNDIVRKVKNVIEETRINPKNLTLEVTESLAINDMERMKHILSQLKALGIRAALDDFGTGYSSLNHIRELPIDIIKIDRCFIEHIAEDDFSEAFVKMVAELAKTLQLSICTEGVENTAQYNMIKEKNIKMIQGFYFSKPLTLEEFEARYV